MDRGIVYPGQIPLDTDILFPQQAAMTAVGWLMELLFGPSTTYCSGLATTQTSVPSMSVLVAPGCIMAAQEVEPNAYGSIAPDTTDSIIKMGVNFTPTTLGPMTAPGSAGQSVVWLVEGQFMEADTSAVVLSYVNAANPASPYSGPSNSAASQNTRRRQTVALQVKEGTPATTGTQVPPTADAGYTPLYTITIAYGASSITNANILQHPAAPFFLPLTNPRMRVMSPVYYVSTAGNDSTGNGSQAYPWLTMQHAAAYIYQNIDSGGTTVTVNVANGTYTSGAQLFGSLTGGGQLSFVGNTGTPTNVIVAQTSGGSAFGALGASDMSVQGMQISSATSGGSLGKCLEAIAGSTIYGNYITFGTAGFAHVAAEQGGLVVLANATYTIAGNAPTHITAGYVGSVNTLNATVTVSGTPAFSTAFASADGAGSIFASGAAYTGSATGARYSATNGGYISTGGGGGSFFPGSSGGSATTGYYV